MPVGDWLLNALYGDPLDKLGAAINPNPQLPPQGGAPAAADGSQGGGGGGAPQSQPAANVGQLMADVYRRGRSADALNRDVALAASAFGTAQQQHDMLNYASSTPTSNPTALVGEALKAQGELTEQQRQARFIAAAGGMGQQLFGGNYTPEQATALAGSPVGAELIKAHLAAAAPTDTMKNINDFIQRSRAQGVPEDQIQQTANDMLSSSIGHLDPLQKEFRNAWNIARQQNPGKSDSEIIASNPQLKDLITYQGAKVQEGKTAAETAEDKVAAKQEYTGMNNNYQNIESPLDWLSTHKDAAVMAIKTPQLFTRGLSGQITGLASSFLPGGGPVNSDVLTAGTYLDQLKNGVSAEKMAGTKNIRNQREFNAVGDSVTNLFAPTADATTIGNQLDRLKNQTYNAHATGILAAGKALPGKYAGYGDSAFLNPSNPLHNEGAADPNNLTGKSQAEVDAAVAQMAPGERYIGSDGQATTKGAETSKTTTKILNFNPKTGKLE